MPIPLSIQLYAPGANGVPSTTNPIPIDLGQRTSSYQHTISDRYGFESMAISFTCTLDEATDWLINGLMRSVVVSGPDAQIVWEGFLETISATVGQKKASLSVSGVANRCRVLFTDFYGTPGSSAINQDTTSQGIYGIKDRIGTLQKNTQAAANAAATAMLNSFAYPRSRESTDAATGGLGDITLDLTFVGWYATLDWVAISNSSAASSATNTQITATYIPGLAAVNAFLGTDTSGVTYTGPSVAEYVAHFSTYKKTIENLLTVGDSSNEQLAWGVYEGRVFRAVVWAGATATTITYTEDAGTGVITDTYGNVVAPWDVRPNAMSQVTQLLDIGIAVGAVDASARKYVGRVTCSIQGDSIGCTLEPSSTDSFEAFLATILPPPGWH